MFRIEPALDHLVLQTGKGAHARRLFRLFTTACSRNAADAKRFDMLSPCSLRGVLDIFFLDKSSDLFFGRVPCDLGKTDHVQPFVLVLVVRLVSLGTALAMRTPNFSVEDQQRCFAICHGCFALVPLFNFHAACVNANNTNLTPDVGAARAARVLPYLDLSSASFAFASSYFNCSARPLALSALWLRPALLRCFGAVLVLYSLQHRSSRGFQLFL